MTNNLTDNGIIDDIRTLINEARKQVVHTVNTVMVATYWEIGRRIVEEEQNGNDRAEYGKYLIKNLAEALTVDFGKGFGETNLKYFRQFYLTFPIRHAVRDELSWTHYRQLIRVENEEARNFYLKEAADGRGIQADYERKKSYKQ